MRKIRAFPKDDILEIESQSHEDEFWYGWKAIADTGPDVPCYLVSQKLRAGALRDLRNVKIDGERVERSRGHVIAEAYVFSNFSLTSG